MVDQNLDMAVKIARAVAERGGTAYYVGGFVRDQLRHAENKDIDIEVHGLAPREVEKILDGLGERISIGESFSVYHLKGFSLDISMPRRADNRGSGHECFEDCVDPFIGTYQAARRRDFTVNAMLENILTGEIVDHFGGTRDLEQCVLRHVDAATFAEDPLRVLRAAQFAARFGFEIAEETKALCASLNLSPLPRERIMGEVEKALLKSEKPSVFFESLREMNQLEAWFPELGNLIGVKQNPKHHSEGDVWTHTMLVTDVAVRYREKTKNPLGFMLAAVTHDFGKAICTEIVNGEIHAYNHEVRGLPLIEKFLRRLTDEKALIEYVLNLSEYHMKPNTMAADGSAVKSTNKLFDSSVDPEGLVCLAISDGLGKTAPREYVPYDDFFRERLAIFREYMSRPYVMGRDLIAAGVRPSERFSDYLSYAHKLRLAGIEKENALRQTLSMAAKNGDYVRETEAGKKG